MDLNKYISDRLDPQIDWYDKKSIRYKNYFFTGNILIIIISALIPFLTSFDFDGNKHLVGFMGVLITIFSGALSIFGFYEKWLLYRSTSEKLKSEKHILDLISEKLSDDEKVEYVKKLEQIIITENKNWLEDNKNKTNTTVT